MREVNFSIPSANKASVGITTALYDRRALDTTSTLPLINSLNNLAYLTTSSVRIRDILTVDGGIERLVCILKTGRSTELMDSWKWNLAFQCLVNIGVRGSEQVRTRLVEADMVPVIATLLENYIQVTDQCRAKIDAEMKRAAHLKPDHHVRHSRARRSHHSRIPPSIDIPPTSHPNAQAINNDTTMTDADSSSTSPPDRPTFARHFQRNSAPSISEATINQPDQENAAFRPVRDIDRLPSMLPILQAEFTQPESPLTPNGVLQIPQSPMRASPSRTTRRPSIRHQLSISNRSEIVPEDDIPDDSTQMDTEAVTLQSDITMQSVEDVTPMENPAAESTGEDTLNMARHALETGASPEPTHTHTHRGPSRTPVDHTPNPYIQIYQERPGPIQCMPRDEDVLMCLQLLAYVSKYCALRKYFQATHTVPRLKTPAPEMERLNCELAGSCTSMDCAHHNTTPVEYDSDDESLEEYLMPDDFNIFPLVEMFTVKHHNADFQYWSRVVMRNLCRKDESKGGIRQCAFWQCGKWEKFVREFAKCRRCRRTKYCSKDCQKKAWVYHRHWCVEAAQ
jgi:hypothetical protein